MLISFHPQQAKQCIRSFQQDGYWQLPPIPTSLEGVNEQVRVLWKENYTLKAIEFYRLHTGCTLKESRDRVQMLCADIEQEDDE